MRAALLLLAFLAPAGHALASPGGGEVTPPIPGALLFAQLTVTKSDLFLQEVFDFTVSVYSRGLTMGREIALSNEEAQGLTFFPYVDLGSGREMAEGKAFDVHRFRGRAQAVATGTFTLRPQVRASVILPRRDREGGSSGAGSGGVEVRPTFLRPTGFSLQVHPLPEEGKPQDFSGAVGRFAFSAVAKPAAVLVGEPVRLTMEIQGRGNIESVAAPQVPTGDEFRRYEPKELRREVAADRLSGRLVFEQSLVPRSTSATSLPAVTFSYFDTEKRSYRKLVAGPFPLRVGPAAQTDAKVLIDAGIAGPASKGPALRAEIAPLKPLPRDWGALPARPWYLSLWLLLLQLAPPGVVVAIFLLVRRREELARNVAMARRRHATGIARSRLGAAREALNHGDAVRFHEALWETLASYVGHRFNLLPGQVSREVLSERFARAGLDAGSVARLGELFLTLERERFGPPRPPVLRISAKERERMADLLQELDHLLRSFEQRPP